mmetsp:Transcript_52628/g.93920  ORF Transcript_52628/g.93920 Transcript_52628/m.93920 type:complete len:385 (+) Transcript_52628:1040-2194(+)
MMSDFWGMFVFTCTACNPFQGTPVGGLGPQVAKSRKTRTRRLKGCGRYKWMVGFSRKKHTFSDERSQAVRRSTASARVSAVSTYASRNRSAGLSCTAPTVMGWGAGSAEAPWRSFLLVVWQYWPQRLSRSSSFLRMSSRRLASSSSCQAVTSWKWDGDSVGTAFGLAFCPAACSCASFRFSRLRLISVAEGSRATFLFRFRWDTFGNHVCKISMKLMRPFPSVSRRLKMCIENLMPAAAEKSISSLKLSSALPSVSISSNVAFSNVSCSTVRSVRFGWSPNPFSVGLDERGSQKSTSSVLWSRWAGGVARRPSAAEPCSSVGSLSSLTTLASGTGSAEPGVANDCRPCNSCSSPNDPSTLGCGDVFCRRTPSSRAAPFSMVGRL